MGDNRPPRLAQTAPAPVAAAFAEKWLRSRPDSVKALMRRFPPACQVRAVPTMQLLCPAPGEIVTVVSYNEKGTVGAARRNADGSAGHVHQCRPRWLELVECTNGQTREWVGSILDAEEGP